MPLIDSTIELIIAMIVFIGPFMMEASESNVFAKNPWMDVIALLQASEMTCAALTAIALSSSQFL